MRGAIYWRRLIMIEVALITWALTALWFKRHEIISWFGI